MKNKKYKKITDLRIFASEMGIFMPTDKDIINEAVTNVLRKYKVIDNKTQAQDIIDGLK